MAKDFRASQVETSKLIASGGIAGTTVGIAIYSGSIASNREGGVSAPHDSKMFENVGTDVFLFVSGSRYCEAPASSITSIALSGSFRSPIYLLDNSTALIIASGEYLML